MVNAKHIMKGEQPSFVLRLIFFTYRSLPRNTFHPLGALLYSEPTYADTLPIVNASDLPVSVFNYTSRSLEYDPVNGSVSPTNMSICNLTTNVPQFMEEIDKYKKYWEEHFKPYATR